MTGVFTKLHPFDALLAHIHEFILGYLSVICFPIHYVLQICIGGLQLLDRSLKLYKQLANSVKPQISNKN
jgi:hypothetical protein